MFLLSYCFIFRTDYSDSETIEEDYMAEIAEMQEQDLRRSSLEEPAGKPVKEKEKRKVYRRSHSLAEIRRPTHVFLPEGNFSLPNLLPQVNSFPHIFVLEVNLFRMDNRRTNQKQ
jgi:hypothetical protein